MVIVVGSFIIFVEGDFVVGVLGYYVFVKVLDYVIVVNMNCFNIDFCDNICFWFFVCGSFVV